MTTAVVWLEQQVCYPLTTTGTSLVYQTYFNPQHLKIKVGFFPEVHEDVF